MSIRVSVESPVIDRPAFLPLRSPRARAGSVRAAAPAAPALRHPCPPPRDAVRGGPRGAHVPSIRKTPIDSTLDIGRYQLSPLSKLLPDNRFTASVSIRSGRGSASQDRVLRLAPRFDDRQQALAHAMAEGIAWLNARGVVAPSTQE